MNAYSLYTFQDKDLDFFAAICLQNDGRGFSIGGCRFIEYPSHDAVIQEAIQLSKAMSYKSAISGLSHNGGKAVIKKSKSNKNIDRKLVLKKFAECVHSLEGHYITTVDSGTDQSDMSIIKNYTPFVTGFLENTIENDPAIFTALGVFSGIQAAVKIIFGYEKLVGLHIAIQGVGHAGYQLAKLLYAAGARLTICDTDPIAITRCVKEFNAAVVAPSEIYTIHCDVFAPCALGQILNTNTISLLNTRIIAGAANNQLVSTVLAESIADRKILYIPDYLINAGGLIYLSLRQENKTNDFIIDAIKKIAGRIFLFNQQAEREEKTLLSIVDANAKTILNTA